jgi:DNA-binding NarL/FixJ family response regulator
MERAPPKCPVCSGAPSVVVAVIHHTMRQLIVELLEQDRAHWRIHALADRRELAALVASAGPDLLVLDDGDLAWCRALPGFPPQRVIVIGPEPDPAYERAARRAGAGAWLTRDRLGEDLTGCMRGALGCAHDPLAEPAA